MASWKAVTLVCIPALFLLACSDVVDEAPVSEAVTETGRWYTASQVVAGQTVFQSQCAVCHGEQAQGLAEDWRERLEDGSFPPPPLNGSAHAWHHPLTVLLQVINDGGIPLGGKMPAFAEVLSEEEKLAAVAFFQDYWNDEIYASWEQMGGTN